MKSWTSVRRPACAPPPKIWISGSGMIACLVAQADGARAAGRGLPPPLAGRPSETAVSALPPSLALFGVPSRAMSFASIAAWSNGSSPMSAGAISFVIPGSASCTSRPPKRFPPSRLSIASRLPREAPAGAIPRPDRAVAERISASTVGRPRESQMRRATSDRMTGSLIARLSMRRRCPSGGGGGSAISGAAHRRTAARSLSRARYSTGDLPSTRARNSAGSSAAARASSLSAGSQSTPAR